VFLPICYSAAGGVRHHCALVKDLQPRI